MIRVEKYYELLKGLWVSISEHWGWGVFESVQEPTIITFHAHADRCTCTGAVAQVLLEAQQAQMVHTRNSGHDDQGRELEVSRSC